MRPGTLQLGALPPLSLYIHLPWCLKKCPYCDFNSHEWSATSAPGDPMPEARYLDALRADLEASLPLVWGRPVHSVFIGGGTPSLFSPEAIDRLLADVRARLPLEPGAEITLEANPGTFEKDRFRAFRQAGVTRLSIGVQSFDDAQLKALGRVHDGAQARAALEEAAQVFDTFNLDLMYALPGQTLAQCEADLRTALSFAPPHLSVYHLTLEPNTWFAKYPPRLPSDDEAYEMLDLITALTAEAGLQRYEVSAYARPGHVCRHNLNYWRFGDYLGIGAGAHGKLSRPAPEGLEIERRWKSRRPEDYLRRANDPRGFVAGRSLIEERELPLEFAMNALRLVEGVPLSTWQAHTGRDDSVLLERLEAAREKGLLVEDADRLGASPQGLLFLNELLAMMDDVGQ